MFRQLEAGLPDTNRVKTLLELGRFYLFKPLELRTDLDSTLYFAQAAHQLAALLRVPGLIEESLLLLSYGHFERKDVKSGTNTFRKVITNYRERGDKPGEAMAWKEMGRLMHRNDSTIEVKIAFFQKAMVLYEQIGDLENQAHTLKEIADVHLNQGKLDLCEEELLSVLDKYKAIDFPLQYTYDLLAIVNVMKGNLNQALYYGLLTIKCMEATGDSLHAGNFYNRLARIYGELGNAEKSVEWYKKSYAKNPTPNYGCCMHIVQGLIQMGKAGEALAFVKEAIRVSPPDNLRDKGIAANALGLCYNALGKYDLAEKYFLEMASSDEQKAWDDTESYRCNIYLTMGQFYVDRDRFASAGPYLRKLLGIPAGIASIRQLKDAHSMLFQVDSAAGNYLDAIRHLQYYKALNDSLFNETKSRQIEELQIRYETENKEQNIRFLQKEGQVQLIKLQKVGMTKNLTLVGIAFLLFVMALLFSRYRIKQRTNRQLELQQIEINRTNQFLQNLLGEKEWLLKEIHHRVKNNLQIVMSLLNTQAMYLESEAALDAIRHSQYRIQSISLIHQKLYQSNNLELIDMSAYIPELVAFLTDSFNTEDRIRFDLRIDPIELDVTKALPIGLILNEAISNAIKYAFPDDRPSLITITMQSSGEGLIELTIADDGTGLPPDFNLSEQNSLGLNLMEGLSKQLGGTFSITNQNGLAIRITFENTYNGQVVPKSVEPEMTA